MRKLLSRGAIVVFALSLVVPVLGGAPAVAVGTDTTVVLTFDHGYNNQALAASLLDAHGMHGTFYVNSDRIGTPGGLTWTQLTQFEAAGHEIGGNSLDNVELTTVPVDVARTQVCQDRINLASHGLTITDFAYPFGKGFANAAVRTIVQNCGYNSARRAWGLYSYAAECGTRGCGYPYASLDPPADPWAVRSTDAATADTTLARLKQYVTNAETHGGGVVPIIFDQICNAAPCSTISTSETTLAAFLDWLQLRAASGTVVKTMREVVDGAVQPIDTTPPSSTIACDGSACTGAWYNPKTPVTLAASDADSGVAVIRYTIDGSTPTSSSPAYTAPIKLAATATVRYRAIDNFGNAEPTQSQLIHVDPAAPTSTIQCNSAPCTLGYKVPATVSLDATDTGGSGVSVIRYTLDGSTPTSGSPAYGGSFVVSSTTTVKFRAYDAAGNVEATRSKVVVIDTIAPSTSMACDGRPCGGHWFGIALRVSLTAGDAGGSGVASIHYSTDGSDPTMASPLYKKPFGLPSSGTVRFRAWDNAGNMEAAGSQAVAVDPALPTARIRCNGKICSTRWSRSSVRVSLSGADTGGSGLAGIRYTTDGSVPTAKSRRYTGPFVVKAMRTVRYRAFDHAGNASAVGTKLIKVDKTRPTLTITAPKTNAIVSGKVRVTVKVSDTYSRVAKVRFYVDGRLLATDKAPAFSFVWDTSRAAKGQHTLTARAVDKAGNSRSKSIVVTVR
jgi:peptidoglycan/xylan/chitin deacetylase (PgdA/CDA1 family)